MNTQCKSNWNNLILVLRKTKFNVKNLWKKLKASQKGKNSGGCILIITFLKASQKGKNSGGCILIITFEQHLDSCSHHK